MAKERDSSLWDQIASKLRPALLRARRLIVSNNGDLRRSKEQCLLMVLSTLQSELPDLDLGELTVGMLDKFMEKERANDPRKRRLWPSFHDPIELDNIPLDQPINLADNGNSCQHTEPQTAVSAEQIERWINLILQRQDDILRIQTRNILQCEEELSRVQTQNLINKLDGLDKRLGDVTDWLIEIVDRLQYQPVHVKEKENEGEPLAFPLEPEMPVIELEAPSREITVGARTSPIYYTPTKVPTPKEEEEDELDDTVDVEPIPSDEGSLGSPMTAEMLEWQKVKHKVFKGKPLSLAVIGGYRKRYLHVEERLKEQTGFEKLVFVPIENHNNTIRHEEMLRSKLSRGRVHVAVIVERFVPPKLADKVANICKNNQVKVLHITKLGQTQALVMQLLQMFEKERVKMLQESEA